MAVYRIYLVHADGTLEPGEAYYCRTDAEAVSRFTPPPAPDMRSELWQGGRFVAVAVGRQSHGARHARDAGGVKPLLP